MIQGHIRIQAISLSLYEIFKCDECTFEYILALQKLGPHIYNQIVTVYSYVQHRSAYHKDWDYHIQTIFIIDVADLLM